MFSGIDLTVRPHIDESLFLTLGSLLVKEMAGWLQDRAKKMDKEEKGRLKSWAKLESGVKNSRANNLYGGQV